jgi:hypothetical protein
MTLDWAGSVSAESPSARVELVKRILAVCDVEEIHRIKKICSNTTRSKNKKVSIVYTQIAKLIL